MASSFISKNSDYGFWINDYLMQVICWGLMSVIDGFSSSDKNRWLKNEYREHIYNCSQGIFVGFINLRLDEFLINQERKRQFIKVVNEAKSFFLHKGSLISVKDLNEFQLIQETKREWVLPLESRRMTNILEHLDMLINDKISTKVSDEIDYEF